MYVNFYILIFLFYYVKLGTLKRRDFSEYIKSYISIYYKNYR